VERHGYEIAIVARSSLRRPRRHDTASSGCGLQISPRSGADQLHVKISGTVELDVDDMSRAASASELLRNLKVRVPSRDPEYAHLVSSIVYLVTLAWILDPKCGKGNLDGRP
jgi:hypothetical protein